MSKYIRFANENACLEEGTLDKHKVKFQMRKIKQVSSFLASLQFHFAMAFILYTFIFLTVFAALGYANATSAVEYLSEKYVFFGQTIQHVNDFMSVSGWTKNVYSVPFHFGALKVDILSLSIQLLVASFMKDGLRKNRRNFLLPFLFCTVLTFIFNIKRFLTGEVLVYYADEVGIRDFIWRVQNDYWSIKGLMVVEALIAIGFQFWSAIVVDRCYHLLGSKTMNVQVTASSLPTYHDAVKHGIVLETDAVDVKVDGRPTEDEEKKKPEELS